MKKSSKLPESRSERLAIAQDPKTNWKLLDELANLPDEDVQQAVVNHPNVSNGTLQRELGFPRTLKRYGNPSRLIFGKKWHAAKIYTFGTKWPKTPIHLQNA